MRPFMLLLYALIFSCSNSFAQQQPGTATPANLKGSWDVQIMNKQHKVITTMTVSFSNQAADSCMSGPWAWKQVLVSNYRTTDADFFPGNDQLAYSLDGNELTIGRMNTCDAYLMLSGKVTGSRFQGNYSIVGIGGGEILGYFKARRN